jgi:type IV pilus assembly protein PilE
MQFKQFNESRKRLNQAQVKGMQGFTLIEILIVIGIIGILSSIAIPSYNEYIIRGTLTEATTALADAGVRMEQSYSDNRTYAGTGTGGCSLTLQNTQSFTLTCAPGTGGQTYTITATGMTTSNVNGFAYSINNQNTRRTISWGSNWGTVPTPAGLQRWLIKKS